MMRNGSSSTDRLSRLAMAAGFAMATPDDRPEEVAPAPVRATPRPVWTSAQPSTSLVVRQQQRRPDTYHAMIRAWVASLGWRAPA